MATNPAARDGIELTPAGLQRLTREYEELRDVKRPAAVAALRQALELAGDLGDNPEYLAAREELDRLEERLALLETRLRTARPLRRAPQASRVVCRGSEVVLRDLDDATVERYVLVASAESDPTQGRLSEESPVGRAIAGHQSGDVVEARAPHGVRHLRLEDVRATRRVR